MPHDETAVQRIWNKLGGETNPVDEFGPERRPDFFCVGAEKAGTTWLWYCLNSHPNVGVPASKELRFFNQHRNFDLIHFRALREFLENPRGAPLRPAFLERVATEIRLLYGGQSAYLRIFGQLNQPIVGELTPQYCLLPSDRIKKMHQCTPGARIVYMLRDPVERLISGARMALHVSGKPMQNDLLLKEANNDVQIALCNAPIHLEKYEAEFGKERVRAFFYDDIVCRPKALLSDICDFIGAEQAQIAPQILAQVVNKGASFEPDAEVYPILFAKLGHIYDRLEARFPEQVNAWRDKYK